MALTSGPVALTIAGFDPSSGAGITADLKTMAAYGVYGISCITALTVQNSSGVTDVQAIDPDFVHATLVSLCEDFPVKAVKIGMLATADIANVVADFLLLHGLKPVILDPVLLSTSGATLLESAGWQVLREKMIGLADVFTPNALEAEHLSGRIISSLDDAVEAGNRLLHFGAKSVIITGGHLHEATDTLVQRDADPIYFPGSHIDTSSTHGTGCAFATALACELLFGKRLPDAVLGAKHYVTQALRAARPLGKGNGPVEHFWK